MAVKTLVKAAMVSKFTDCGTRALSQIGQVASRSRAMRPCRSAPRLNGIGLLIDQIKEDRATKLEEEVNVE